MKTITLFALLAILSAFNCFAANGEVNLTYDGCTVVGDSSVLRVTLPGFYAGSGVNVVALHATYPLMGLGDNPVRWSPRDILPNPGGLRGIQLGVPRLKIPSQGSRIAVLEFSTAAWKLYDRGDWKISVQVVLHDSIVTSNELEFKVTQGGCELPPPPASAADTAPTEGAIAGR